MADKFLDPKTGKELFKINDSNQESFTEDFKKKIKDKVNGTSDHNESEPRRDEGDTSEE